MRPASPGLFSTLISLISLVAAACGSTSRGTFDDGKADADGVVPAPEGGKPPAFTDGGLDSSPTVVSEVFGHSGKTLYRLDPDTKGVTVVGDFSGCNDSVIDIALDEKSQMYGTTFKGLYRIDKGTARCTPIVEAPGLDFPNSLSFVPKGTLDATAEVLVGYVGDAYVRIDTTTGAIRNVGTLGDGTAATRNLVSSGDVVSVIGGPTYLSVKSTATSGACTATDCLVELDPRTGKIVKNLGALTGHNDVFGLAFWAGKVYGVDKAGKLFEVEPKGASLSLTEITIPQRPSDLSFFGAGSTTSAPVQPR